MDQWPHLDSDACHQQCSLCQTKFQTDSLFQERSFKLKIHYQHFLCKAYLRVVCAKRRVDLLKSSLLQIALSGLETYSDIF